MARKKLMSLIKAIMRLKQSAENTRVVVKQNTIDVKKGCCLQMVTTFCVYYKEITAL